VCVCVCVCVCTNVYICILTLIYIHLHTYAHTHTHTHTGKPDQTLQKMIDAGDFPHLKPFIQCASKIQGQTPPTPAEMKAVGFSLLKIDEYFNA
jgi:hypothetical protein